MTEDRLAELLGTAIGPPAALDVAELDRRLRRRQRHRAAGRAALALGVVVVVAVPVGRIVDGRQPQVRFAPVADLAPFDPDVQVADGVLPLDEEARSLEPTMLLDGAVRCGGPTSTGAVTVTTYCLEDGGEIEVMRGPHWTLPETGEPIPVADRTGYVDGMVLTASDADSMDDTHHRIDGGGHLSAAEMAEVLASIPVVASGPTP